MKFPPWTVDQFQRYRILGELIRSTLPGKEASLLDVGGVSPDLQGEHFWLPGCHIHRGFTVSLDLTFCSLRGFVQGEALRLPFKDSAFDAVAALDVLEHIDSGQRELVLLEMCRVSRNLVLVSAPFRSRFIEDVENRLLTQLKCLTGEIQQQLVEHRTHGLPEIHEIEQSLSSHLRSVQGFEYGSLTSWFLLQTLKNCFRNKRNSWIIHREIERWVASRPPEEEFETPASHYYWLGSKTHSPEEWGTFTEEIKKTLVSTTRKSPSFDEALVLHKEIVDHSCRPGISALIVSTGRLSRLKLCLDHLLTQKIDSDLEVSVWNIGGNPSVDSFLQDHYPAVTCFPSGQQEETSSALFKIMERLAGEFILLLAEYIIVPTETLQKFYDHMIQAHPPDLLSPRIIDTESRNHVTGGAGIPLKKNLAGRFPGLFKINPGGMFTWIYSECLFFRRSAVWDRQLVRKPVRASRLFLWEKRSPSQALTYLPDLSVHKN